MILVVLGGAAVLTGSALFVTAFRAGQRGEQQRERTLFRGAVVGLGLGSALFVIALMTAGEG